MSRVLVAVAGAALSASLAFGQTAAPKTEPTPRVGVFLDFDSAPGKTSLEVMKKEVDSLLRPSGVALDWRLTRENHGVQSFDGLVVMKFKGKCKVEPWQDPDAIDPGRSGTLGSTLVVGGRVLPFSEVKCDAVKQALSYLRPEAGTGERQKALGLAMGRVVAHELYHILARTTDHAAKGLAKAAESLQDLVSGLDIPFRSEETEAIRKGLLQ